MSWAIAAAAGRKKFPVLASSRPDMVADNSDLCTAQASYFSQLSRVLRGGAFCLPVDVDLDFGAPGAEHPAQFAGGCGHNGLHICGSADLAGDLVQQAFSIDLSADLVQEPCIGDDRCQTSTQRS